MKKILFLTFYFDPDLCAGSFRNSPLAKELARQLKNNADVHVITTLPNRYRTFDSIAPEFEQHDNLKIHRILIPKHKSGFTDQINSFKTYFFAVNKLIKNQKFDLVFASSSRLFTAYLGYTIARKRKIPLYLDIRDIFADTMRDVLSNKLLKASLMPVLNSIEKRVFNYAVHINLISAGFKAYFVKFNGAQYSYFSNGIDEEFLHVSASVQKNNGSKVITYAGNIGEGQGLHKIIPQAANALGNSYKFLIVGDGGAKTKLVRELEKYKLTNVEIREPMSRKELLKVYDQSDFLFLHLNDYEAFEKVLPSKIFELAAYDKPIIAGVAGYANQFIIEHVPNHTLFLPGHVYDMVSQLKAYTYKTGFRMEFIKKFKRETINHRMAESIASYLS